MAGRRALPYSPEAEDQLTPSAGRRKTPWRDRPKFFTSLEAAGTFAAHRAVKLQHRQRVRLEVTLDGEQLWAVRPTHGSITLHASGLSELRRAMIASLDRMAREA